MSKGNGVGNGRVLRWLQVGMDRASLGMELPVCVVASGRIYVGVEMSRKRCTNRRRKTIRRKCIRGTYWKFRMEYKTVILNPLKSIKILQVAG